MNEKIIQKLFEAYLVAKGIDTKCYPPMMREAFFHGVSNILNLQIQMSQMLNEDTLNQVMVNIATEITEEMQNFVN